jgi:hypothetical protein
LRRLRRLGGGDEALWPVLPVAKAGEVFCERWTPLILRDLALGASRFSELQHGVPLASRSLLSLRLKQLEKEGFPTASDTHFFMWLFFAAPASFFSLESASQVVVASLSHFVMKLLSAAPANFLSAASDLQVAKTGPDETRQTTRTIANFPRLFSPSMTDTKNVLPAYDGRSAIRRAL